MAEPNMAASLAHDDPASLAQGCDELRARDDREPLARQAGSGSVRLTIPMSRLRPSSRNPSM